MSNDICNNGCSRSYRCGITLDMSKCPCTECLVKAKCTVICDERENFWHFCLSEELRNRELREQRYYDENKHTL